MGTRTVTLQTLTPLWTGGAKSEMDRVHETGILGSLRWWYEVLVRGVGGWACDPTGDRGGPRCIFDSDQYDSVRTTLADPLSTDVQKRQALRDACVCDACQLFGTTGWRRRFRLVVDQSGLHAEQPNRPANSSIERPERQPPLNPRPQWNVPGGRSGRLILHLFGDDGATGQIVDLLKLIAPYAAIGARVQTGYGVVRVLETDPALPGTLLTTLAQLPRLVRPHQAVDDDRLPARDRMFFVLLRVNNLRGDPIREMLHTKVELRGHFRPERGDMDVDRRQAMRTLRHQTMGTIQGERKGAMINVSRPYWSDAGGFWVMRIWGWAPASERHEVFERVDDYLIEREDQDGPFRDVVLREYGLRAGGA